MSVQGIHSLLSEHPFFKDLDPSYLDLIAGCGKNVQFEKDQFIFREGEMANSFYMLRKGAVTLELHSPSRGSLPVETLHEGEVLGWSWLVHPYRWQFDARATESVRAISLDGRCLRGKCESDHELGYLLMKRVAEIFGKRLQATRIRLLDLYGKSP